MAEKNSSMTFCPFWIPTSLKCNLCTKGLFIPLEDHIEIYCKTEEYQTCSHYILSIESYRQSVTSNVENPNYNRRRHVRIEGIHPVTLNPLNSGGKVVPQFSIHAKTLDLSLGGLRLQTKEPLINDTLIRFSFDDFAHNLFLTGTAIIRWCHQLINSSEYQAGLAFCDNQATEAMKMYLQTHTPLC